MQLDYKYVQSMAFIALLRKLLQNDVLLVHEQGCRKMFIAMGAVVVIL